MDKQWDGPTRSRGDAGAREWHAVEVGFAGSISRVIVSSPPTSWAITSSRGREAEPT